MAKKEVKVRSYICEPRDPLKKLTIIPEFVSEHKRKPPKKKRKRK